MSYQEMFGRFDTFKADMEKGRTKGGKITYLRGRNSPREITVRFVKDPSGDINNFIPVREFWLEEQRKGVLCLDDLPGPEECRILKALNDEPELVKKPSRNLYANVVVRGNEEDGVGVLAAPVSVYEGIIDILFKAHQEGQDLLDPYNGRDFVISKRGEGLKTRYPVNVAFSSSMIVPGDSVKTDEYAVAPVSLNDRLVSLYSKFQAPAVNELLGIDEDIPF